LPATHDHRADARPIRRSRGDFDRRIDSLPEAQLRKAGARGKTQRHALRRPRPARNWQKTGRRPQQRLDWRRFPLDQAVAAWVGKPALPTVSVNSASSLPVSGQLSE
jgi:hypothetical protein